MIGLLLAALAGQTPADAQLQVVALPAEVSFGEPFEMVVERRWPAAAPPPAWRPELLAPLRVVTVARETRVADGTEAAAQVVERRTLHAWAFATGDLSWPGAGLRVRGTLDPAAPGGLWDPAAAATGAAPARRGLQAAALLAVLASLALLVRVVRDGRDPTATAAPAPTRSLRAWADAARDDPAALRAALDAALAAVGVDGGARTAEELRVDSRLADALGAPGQAAVAMLRGALDAAHYAARPPAARGALAAAARTVADAVDAADAAREAAA